MGVWENFVIFVIGVTQSYSVSGVIEFEGSLCDGGVICLGLSVTNQPLSVIAKI